MVLTTYHFTIGDYMLAKDLDNAWKTFLTSLQERDVRLQECYSIIIKLWVLVKNVNFRIQTLSQVTFLQEIYLKHQFHLADSVPFFEYYKVSNVLLEREHVENLCQFLANMDIENLLSLVKGLESRKAIGQYFTSEELINQIYRKVKSNSESQKFSTVVDFSAGVGYFLKPFLGNNHTTYGVELDPLVYELMLFSFLFQKELSEKAKAKLILTIKQGDSLTGFREKDVDLLYSKSTVRNKFIELISVRAKILSSDIDINNRELIEFIKLRDFFREKFLRFQEFNWFIDFPELFFDSDGNLLNEYGVDLVVGNPPWIYYKEVEKEQYKKTNLDPKISAHLHGKYNFSLPFVIMANIISKGKGCLVVPQGLITETYANRWRENVYGRRVISDIILCRKDWFKEVVNEFCVIFWDQQNKFSDIKLWNESEDSGLRINYDSINQELNLLRILPKDILEFLKKIKQTSPSFSNFVSIRRGLTLTRKYQLYYENVKNMKKYTTLKKLIRSNSFSTNKRNGVFNFQLYYSGENFVYDKNLLGAPGTESFFEQPKIIRRNRGNLWFVGLDLDGKYYVNDIFDIIFPKHNQYSVKFIYGYLCSSTIQLLAESLLVRDITSNVVRDFPFPSMNYKQCTEIEESVDLWLKSQKTEDDFLKMRRKINNSIYDFWQFPDEIKTFIEDYIDLNWRE